VIGDEPRLAYERVLLSPVLTGETALEAIELKPMSWCAILPLKHRERHRSNFCRRSAPCIDEVIE
jgi:NAD(P)H-nitrite reductase large subunit